MAVYKIMYWRPDVAPTPAGVPEEASEANFKSLATRLTTRFCNVHYLIGYNQASLADFREMAEELRKTFPEAKDEDIGCSKVTKSSCCHMERRATGGRLSRLAASRYRKNGILLGLTYGTHP